MNTVRKACSCSNAALNIGMYPALLLLALWVVPVLATASEFSPVFTANQDEFSFQATGSEAVSVASTDASLTTPMMANVQRQLDDEKMRSRLSTLWTAVTLNMITADVLTLYIPEAMEDWEDFADGKESEIMLAGALMYQVPISMVFLSRILPHETNRWTNIIAAGVMSGAVIAGGSPEPQYWVFAGAEVIGMSIIAWNAWHWENPDDDSTIQNLNLGIDINKDSYGLACSFNFQL